MPSKIDGVLETCGSFGRYQWIQVTLTGFNSLVAAFHFIAIVFHSITPDFRCALDGWENDTYTPVNENHNQSIYEWIPLDKDGKLDSCITYNLSSSNATSDCNRYVFHESAGWGNTLNVEFGMVCSKLYFSTTVKVIFTIGLVLGAVAIGVMGDRYGRRTAIIGSMFFGAVGGVVAMFSVNIYIFGMLRFLIAFFFVGVMLLDHVVTMEIVGPSRRTYAIAYKSMFWPAGTMLTSLVAYYLRDWNWFQLGCSIPAAVLMPINLVLLKETPHYLVTKGRHKEAAALFKHIAHVNGRSVPDKMLEDLKEDEAAAVSERMASILKAPILLQRTAIFLYLWFIAGLGFYGLNFNVANLTGNVYINNVISGAAELPQAILALVSYRVGRKAPMVSCLFIGSLALVSSSLMNVYLNMDKYGSAVVVVSMIGKFAISTVFTFDYFWSSEVFPSTLRSSLVGLCSLFARVGSILSPIIVDLHEHVQTLFGSSLGSLIFGVTMFIGGLLALLLPETNKQKLPETIAEANVFMTGRSRDTGEGDEKYNASSTAVLVSEKTTGM